MPNYSYHHLIFLKNLYKEQYRTFDLGIFAIIVVVFSMADPIKRV